jgi:hypothetical protein
LKLHVFASLKTSLLLVITASAEPAPALLS